MRKAAAQQAQDALRRAGLRATTPRLRLYGALSSSAGPRSIEDLRRIARGMDTATVYRTLASFVEAGLASRVVPQTGDRALYEAAGEHHHHLVCMKCGKVEDVDVCVPARLAREALAASRQFARVDSHVLEFSGLCRACARA